MINDDITVEKPIDDYYAELDKRLQGLKSQLGTDADWMPSTYEKYMTGQHQVAGSLQRNVREYYNDFKLLRADTQVRMAMTHAVGPQAHPQAGSAGGGGPLCGLLICHLLWLRRTAPAACRTSTHAWSCIPTRVAASRPPRLKATRARARMCQPAAS